MSVPLTPCFLQVLSSMGRAILPIQCFYILPFRVNDPYHLAMVVKPLDFKYESGEEFRESVEFDGFKIYYFRGEYIDDCIEKYKAYYRRFSGKSARF